MKGVIVEDGYIMNFDKRCLHCRACETYKIDEGRSNLIENSFGTIMCKNPEECQANIVAENTMALEVEITDNLTIRDKYNNEITFKDMGQPQFTDDFKGYFGNNHDEEGDGYEF
jgi:hypothetical protein